MKVFKITAAAIVGLSVAYGLGWYSANKAAREKSEHQAIQEVDQSSQELLEKWFQGRETMPTSELLKKVNQLESASEILDKLEPAKKEESKYQLNVASVQHKPHAGLTRFFSYKYNDKTLHGFTDVCQTDIEPYWIIDQTGEAVSAIKGEELELVKQVCERTL